MSQCLVVLLSYCRIFLHTVYCLVFTMCSRDVSESNVFWFSAGRTFFSPGQHRWFGRIFGLQHPLPRRGGVFFSRIRFSGGVRPFWSKNPNSGFPVILVEKPEFGFSTATRSSVSCSDTLCLLEDRILLVALLPWGMELPAISSEVPSRVFSSSIVQVAGVVSFYYGFLLRPALPASDAVCAMTFIQ